VVILSGIYVTHSDWILLEIEIAKSYQKPIIGVAPWGQRKFPKVVKDEAIQVVGWNTPTIINAIRKHAI